MKKTLEHVKLHEEFEETRKKNPESQTVQMMMNQRKISLITEWKDTYF